MAVSPEFLRSLVMSARAQGIAILSLADALACLTADPHAPFICLTFDDGYRGVYSQAFQVFAELKAPFAVFLTSDLVDNVRPMWWDAVERLIGARNSVMIDGRVVSARSLSQKRALYAKLALTFRASPSCEHTQRLTDLLIENSLEPNAVLSGRALTWTMLEHMLDSRLLTVGAHTVTHPVLADLSIKELEDELVGSRVAIENRLGIHVNYMAYPFGQRKDIGSDAPASAEKVGYTAAFTTEARPVRTRPGEDAYALPRVLISQSGQSSRIIRAYMSGLPAAIKRVLGRA